MKRTKRYLIALLAVGATCALLAGCVRQQQYRTEFDVRPYDPSQHVAKGAVVETTPRYLVGYLEFDDQGWQFGGANNKDRSQLEFVLDRFKEESRTNGLLIVTFVHGWKHDASGMDSNVATFHQVLDRMGRVEEFLSKEQRRPARRVAGVYIGWRGLSSGVEPFKELSFWGRKTTAEQVGHGAVIEALSELEELRNRNNLAFAEEIAKRQRMSTKLFIVGHSFGGDIVYSAVAPILKERMVENFDQNGKPIPPKTLGDLVVLINPAFEAARFETIERLATGKRFPAVSNCVLAVFTSTADTATGFFFPLGRRISTLFDTYENADQGKANITAVGHYQPYIDYDLKVSDKIAVTEPAASSATNAVKVARQIERTARRAAAGTNATREDLTYTFTHVALIPRTDCMRQNPVFNVAVDPRIIPDHDTITLPIFTRFLSEFLTAFSSSVE